MFVKMSLRDRLDCLVVFVGMILLCLLLLLAVLPYASSLLRLPSPSPNCFLSVCLPTLFAADLKVFLPLITSPISGAANSNKSAPTYAFCSWDDIFTQKWNCSSPNNWCKCTESPSPLSSNRPIVWNFYLS